MHGWRLLGLSCLDLMTDKCALSYLLITLSTFYPRYGFLFELSMYIDMMHTVLQYGVTYGPPLIAPTNCNYWIMLPQWMKFYYTDRRVLFAMHAGNELFYAMLYLSYFTSGPLDMFVILAVICFPVAVLKSAIACLHVIPILVFFVVVVIIEQLIRP